MSESPPLRAPGGRDYVAEYASRAPLALALERALECRLLSRYAFERPILDLGCGDGCFIEVLFGPGASVEHGLDPNEDELERARDRNVYLELHRAAGSSIPLPDGTVSSVLSNSTLEHIADLDAVLAEIRRVLAPGGTLFMTVPTDKFDRYAIGYRSLRAVGLGDAAERFRVGYDHFWRHFHFYAPKEWKARLERAGLVVIEIVEYDSRTRCAVHDGLVPAALPAFLVKKALGRYFIAPPLRRAFTRLIRPILPADRVAQQTAGTGGLVLLRATKIVESARR